MVETYKSKRGKAVAAKGWATQEGQSVQQTERIMNVELFLEGQTKWEEDSPHQLVMLYEMFMHAANEEWKEAEFMVCQGHWGSVYDSDSEVDQSAMELVGYHTSQKEIRNVYQSIYLLWRAPGLPPCRAQLRRKAIQDILSSLKGQLLRHGCSATTADWEPQDEQVRPNQWGSYEEALGVACQRALDTAEALMSDIERLSQRRRDRSQTHSQNWSWSRRCLRTRSQSRSHSRAWSQNHSQSSPQNVCLMSPDGPPSRRRVTFRNPKMKLSSERDTKDYSTEPSVSNMETWLEWQAKQLGNPTWWMELQAILGIRDPWKLAWKIRASFYIPEVRMRTLLEPEYTAPPTPRSLDRNAFLPDDLSYQDMQQKPALLTMAYTRSLQYWVEKQSLPRSQNLRPLAESVIELWEAVKEYVTLNYLDIIQGLGMTDEESPSHESHATIFSHVVSSPKEEQELRRTTTYITSTATKRDTSKYTASPARTERENPCLLLVTASVAWLNLGPGSSTARRSTAEGNAFQNPWMVATFSIPPRAVCYGDVTIKVLDG